MSRKWEAVKQFLARCSRRRDKAMLALMVYGGLRRAEVVRLNVGDYQPPFGLRRVLGKGGHETIVPLPDVARVIVNEYLANERPGAAASEPLLQLQYKWYGGEKKVRRMSGQRVWKIIKDLGKRRRGHDPPACISPRVRRRVAQAVRRQSPCGAGASPSRRHSDDDDIHAARAAGPAEGCEPVRRNQRRSSAQGVSIPSDPGRKSFAENLNENKLVAQRDAIELA